jgi:hypothetical protein
MESNLIELQQRREQILQEMAAIDRLRRGHLSEQFFKTTHQGKTLRQGPYYVLQRWFQGKNLCERIPADQVEPIRQGVQGYKRFQQLAEEFALVSEQITLMAGHIPEAKKKRKSPPGRSSSGKPPAS